jgi:8-hydroxy-5-deazaflavin:NADPH oxidoreductase
MKITVLGRGNVGGGLAALWTAAGHTVTPLGRDGGDGADADVLVVAVPGDRVADALARVSGIAGKPVVDATNVYGVRGSGHESNAHLVRSLTGGPVAKSFSANFASEYAKLAAQATPPGNLVAAEPEIRELVDRLNRDAGFEPIHVGGLEMARKIEDIGPLLIGIAQNGIGPYFYRVSPTTA